MSASWVLRCRSHRQWYAILIERISALLPWATHQAQPRVTSAARIRRRGALRLGMAGMAVTLADAMTTNLSPVEAQATGPDGVQLGEIYKLQAAFHQAKSHQDIDLMMSLWSPDASFNFNGDVFSGADAIRAFFLGSGSWKYRRMSLVPSFKDQIRLDGDQTYLYFECHDVALTDESAAAPAGTVVTHLSRAGPARASCTHVGRHRRGDRICSRTVPWQAAHGPIRYRRGT